MTSELDSLVWRSSSKKMKSRRERQKFKDYDVNHFAVAVQQQKDKTKSRWTMMSWIALPKRSSRKRTTEDANDEKIEDYGVNDFAVAVQQKDTQINFGKDTRREMTLESTRLKDRTNQSNGYSQINEEKIGGTATKIRSNGMIWADQMREHGQRDDNGRTAKNDRGDGVGRTATQKPSTWDDNGRTATQKPA
ncbi:hypothetical protein DAPPUDRAFT_120729, partial [Daphnia pulex]